MVQACSLSTIPPFGGQPLIIALAGPLATG